MVHDDIREEYLQLFKSKIEFGGAGVQLDSGPRHYRSRNLAVSVNTK